MVKKLAGEVGDQIAIGIGAGRDRDRGRSACRQAPSRGSKRGRAAAGRRRGSADRGAGRSDPGHGDRSRSRSSAARPQRPRPQPKPEAAPTVGRAAHGAKVLASPAVRQRARDLGIDLGQVKTAERPHPPRRSRRLSALQWRQRLGPRRRAARRRDDQGRRPAPQDRREYAGGEAPHPAFHLGRGIRRHRRSRTRGR